MLSNTQKENSHKVDMETRKDMPPAIALLCNYSCDTRFDDLICQFQGREKVNKDGFGII